MLQTDKALDFPSPSAFGEHQIEVQVVANPPLFGLLKSSNSNYDYD